jgi:hypothetical protein
MLPSVSDGIDGTLVVAECFKNIPFIIKRIYYIYDLENRQAVRGKHAHRNLEQVIFCINGSFVLGVDDGTNKENILMNQRNQGIYLGTKVWHTMADFSPDCLMLVLASDTFNESDYIRNYNEFIDYLKSF